MLNVSPHTRKRLARLVTHTQLSFLAYRYRYLVTFTAIGIVSILLELALVRSLPLAWPWTGRAMLAFVAGLAFSFAFNARFNFCVPRPHLFATFRRFALVSGTSFTLNFALVSLLRHWYDCDYAPARLCSSALIFLFAYTLHRRYTFQTARNFGVAVYASTTERVDRIFLKLGRNCDHVHVDLVDKSMNPSAAPVDLGKIATARRYWPGIPVCLHVMSNHPSKWAERTWDQIDWLLFHVGTQDDPFELILRARGLRKKVGIVWHLTTKASELMPLLPHVDFVMILGIKSPGASGQSLQDAAVDMAETIDRLRVRYGFEVMFDGGVNATTVERIRAKYIVAASGVLRTTDPIRACHTLRTGARYERRAA